MSPTRRGKYDAAYFRRYYLDPRTRVLAPAERRRRVAAVVALAERFLERPLATVLDVGCGVGLWGREILRLRPRVEWTGVEPSAAARRAAVVARPILAGSLADLDRLVARRRFDLVLCVDVLHYLPEATIARALPALASRTGGLACLEVLTSADEVEGDLAGFLRRTPAWYRRRFAAAGLAACGAHCYLGEGARDSAAALERLD
jgi:SAM-dependent methyltransferase